MPFKQLVLEQDVRLKRPAFYPPVSAKPLWQDFLENQSPIMKFWFAAMLANLVILLCILH